jgi:hypothetical protein
VRDSRGVLGLEVLDPVGERCDVHGLEPGARSAPRLI